MWLCVFVLLLPAASAYAPAFHYLFSVPLPDVPVSDGVSLLHEPERWAGGAGLLIGVPPFKIRKVSMPLVSEKECMVNFETEISTKGGEAYDVKSVRCVARGPHECRLRIADAYKCTEPSLVSIRIIPVGSHSQSVGMTVMAEITTDEVITEDTFEGIRRNLALCLATCNSPVKHDKGLDLYRQHIKEHVI